MLSRPSFNDVIVCTGGLHGCTCSMHVRSVFRELCKPTGGGGEVPNGATRSCPCRTILQRMTAISEQLEQLTLTDVVETSRALGAGAYGEVVEVRLGGLKCAGKKLHGLFFQQSSPSEQQAIVSRFVEECVR